MISAFGVEHGEVSKSLLKLMGPQYNMRVMSAEKKAAKAVDAVRRGKGAKTGILGLMQPQYNMRVKAAEAKGAAKVDRVRRGG